MNFSKESIRLSGDDDKLVTQGDEVCPWISFAPSPHS